MLWDDLLTTYFLVSNLSASGTHSSICEGQRTDPPCCVSQSPLAAASVVCRLREAGHRPGGLLHQAHLQILIDVGTLGPQHHSITTFPSCFVSQLSSQWTQYFLKRTQGPTAIHFQGNHCIPSLAKLDCCPLLFNQMTGTRRKLLWEPKQTKSTSYGPSCSRGFYRTLVNLGKALPFSPLHGNSQSVRRSVCQGHTWPQSLFWNLHVFFRMAFYLLVSYNST